MIRSTPLLLYILFSLSGCEPAVTFTEPQPADTKSLSRFPSKLQGFYRSEEGNPFLKIDDHTIIRIYDIHERINKNQIDSNFRLVGDTLIEINDNNKFAVHLDGDTLEASLHVEDTIFFISNYHVLKKFKGYYFLNTNNTEKWRVKKIYLKKGVLSINTISYKEEIANLREITESTSDTTSYSFSPTRHQFKHFIRENGFANAEYYVKVKK